MQAFVAGIGVALGMSVAAPGGAWAQQARATAPGLEPEILQITPGGRALGRAAGAGTSAESDANGGLKWRDMLFLNTLDGIDYNLLTGENFRLGVTGADGLGNHGDFGGLWSAGVPERQPALGAFGQYSLENWTFEASISRMTEGSGGLVADLGVRWNTRLSDSWFVEVGPSVTWASGDYEHATFGPQSRGSGLHLHDSNPGLKDVTVSGSVSYSLTDNWTVGGMVGAQRFLGDVATSPLVKEESNIFGGISFGYRF